MTKSRKPADPFAKREAERYDSPIPSREYMLEILADEGPLTDKQLIRRLSVKGQERRHALQKRLAAMQRDGQVLCNRAGEYGVVNKMDLVPGKVEAHRDGFGFLLRDGDDDIYLPAFQMRQLIHGDEALVSITGENRRGQPEGKVVEVIARNTERIVGRLATGGDEMYVVPDNPRVGHDFLVDRNAIGKAGIGDYVVLQITHQPGLHQRPRGMVVEHLGAPMAPGLEIDVAIHRYELPSEWPADCEKQVGKLGSEPAAGDKKGRHDLRKLPLVTIDGEDARDFDDAVYCEKKRGGYTLWVAIADVAHYVPAGSALDNEAFTRGTSVYFPGRVVPMLPEKLSNGLCSLNPEVDRLCMVCEMEISNAGEVKSYQFYEAVMHSHARLTYSEVAEVLGLLDREPRKGLKQRLQQRLPELKNLYSLFQCLLKRRQKRGAIEFETVETQMVFNEQRKIDEIVPRTRNEAHRIIEECMLCANVAAADFLQSHKIDALYRVHEGPKPEKLLNLRSYLSQLGLQLDGGDKPQPRHYQQLMQAVESRPDAHLIQVMLLRSMNQAVYQPDNQGHFGLAYEAYAHFTSPIRRYPDLLVHRALKQVIRSRRKSTAVRRIRGAGVLAAEKIYPYDAQAMVAAGLHCSMTERRADEATRDVVAWLKCEYLQAHIGSVFNGVITGVTGFGFFVELDDLYVEGLVHISNLGQDYFHYDPVLPGLVGERTRRQYRMGDSVVVSVASVDMDQRRVDLDLQNTGKPGKGGDDSGRRKSGGKKSSGKSARKKPAAKRPAKKAAAKKKPVKKKAASKKSSKRKPKSRRR